MRRMRRMPVRMYWTPVGVVGGEPVRAAPYAGDVHGGPLDRRDRAECADRGGVRHGGHGGTAAVAVPLGAGTGVRGADGRGRRGVAAPACGPVVAVACRRR